MDEACNKNASVWGLVDSMDKKGVVRSTDDDKGISREEKKDSLWDCIEDCVNDANSTGLWWNSTKNLCSIKAPNGTVKSKGEKTDCIRVYKKEGNDICKREGTATPVCKEKSKTGVPVVFSFTHSGDKCRQDIADGKIKDKQSIEKLEEWCVKNPNYTVCDVARKNGVFGVWNRYGIILGIVITVFSIVLGKPLGVVFGVIVGIGSLLLYYKPWEKKEGSKTNGGSKSFVSNEKKECDNVLWNCTSGERCVLDPKGKTLGKFACENEGCCPVGYTKKEIDGVKACYQDKVPETASVSYSPPSIFGLNMYHTSCGKGMRGGGGRVKADGTTDGKGGGCGIITVTQKGDWWCNGGLNPKWVECTTQGGCVATRDYYYEDLPFTGKIVKLKPGTTTGKLKWCKV